MDITYRPFIRDVYLDDNIRIKGYIPKYNKKETSIEDSSEIEETPVESDILEIRQREGSKKPYRFSSKKEFQDTMIPLYEEMLIKKGLNPEFARSLVAQDGLESAWGSKPAGRYNFGGIKGKGSIRRTREVINGKDIYINSSFRDFDSLEDYVNYKINLLNNNRYRAFSGTVSEFADRVSKGGYATDPRYSKILNQVIASAKHGGTLKFQEGGALQYGKEWVRNWLKSRKKKLKENYDNTTNIPVPIPSNSLYKIITRNLDRANGKIDPSKFDGDVKGRYVFPPINTVYLKEEDPTVAVHEFTHATQPKIQTNMIEKIIDSHNNNIYHDNTTSVDEYLDDRDEMYSRMMQFREWAQRTLNVGPDHVWTTEEIDNLKEKYFNGETILGGRLTGIYDKNHRKIKGSPTRETQNYKFYTDFDVPRETRGFLDRYNSHFIKSLLNDVAQNNKVDNNKNYKETDTLYAQKGVKLERSWDVSPEYLKSRVPLFNRNSVIVKNDNTENREFKDQEWTDKDIQKLISTFEGGYKNKVYLDHKKNPTAGIGHKLTEEELKLYPVGSLIPDNIGLAWWKADYSRAKEEVEKYYGDSIPSYQKAALTNLVFQGGSKFIRGKRNHKSQIVSDSKYFKNFEKELKNYNKKDPSASLERVLNEMQYTDDTNKGQSRRYGVIRALIENKIKPEDIDKLMTSSADSLIGYKSNKYEMIFKK